MASGLSPKTLRNRFSFLRSALAEALVDGLIAFNPVDGVKLSNYVEKNNKVDNDGDHEDVDPFTPDEMTAIYSQCEPDELNIVELVFDTGMRPSEWSALTWKNVNFKQSFIEVKEAIVNGSRKGTKTRAGKRRIPLNEIAIKALERQKSLAFIKDGFVFPKNIKCSATMLNGEYNRINPDSFRKHRWSRILKNAKVRYRYPYQMRHTYATRHISQGINLWQLANWLGHASPEMLFRHYGSFIEAHQEDQLSVYP